MATLKKKGYVEADPGKLRVLIEAKAKEQKTTFEQMSLACCMGASYISKATNSKDGITYLPPQFAELLNLKYGIDPKLYKPNEPKPANPNVGLNIDAITAISEGVHAGIKEALKDIECAQMLKAIISDIVNSLPFIPEV